MAGNGTSYKPDTLSSGGATQKPFSEAGVPKTGSIVPTLIKLALRRLPGKGFATEEHTSGVPKSNAFTAGSHGSVK